MWSQDIFNQLQAAADPFYTEAEIRGFFPGIDNKDFAYSQSWAKNEDVRLKDVNTICDQYDLCLVAYTEPTLNIFRGNHPTAMIIEVTEWLEDHDIFYYRLSMSIRESYSADFKTVKRNAFVLHSDDALLFKLKWTT